MSQFSAAANLSISVDQQELRGVRREIERGVGDVSVGVNSMRPDGGRPGGGVGRGQGAGILDASRKQLGAVESLVDLNEEQVDLLDDLVESTRMGGGGGGGGLGFGAGSIVGGLTSGASLAGGLAAGAGVGLGLAGLAGGRESLRNVGVFRNLDALLSGRPGQGRPPTWEEGVGTAIANLGGPIGGLFAEDITRAIESADFPKPPWVDAVTGPPSGAESRRQFRESDPAIGPTIPTSTRENRRLFRTNDPALTETSHPAGREARREFRERVNRINQNITVESNSTELKRFEQKAERIAEKKAKEMRRELEREISRGGSFGRGIR